MCSSSVTVPFFFVLRTLVSSSLYSSAYSYTRYLFCLLPNASSFFGTSFCAGSSVESYFPEDLSFKKVVGLGMNAEEMGANSRLTERIVQNLNAKVRT